MTTKRHRPPNIKPENMQAGVGRRMREFRQAKEKPNSLDALAKILRVDRSVVNRYELGGTTIPANHLPAIADFLGVSIADLFA